MALINWLLKPKCMLKYFFEFFFVVWKYDVIFSLRDLAVCMKIKTFFKKKFWWKPGILVPNLYFYDVNIQTNIKQNLVAEYAKESQIFKNIYFLNFFGPGRTRPAHFGLGQTCLAQWTVEHSPLFTQNSGDGAVKKKKEGRGADLRWLRGCAAGGCWPENGLDGGRPFFFFSVFFSSALFSSVSVFSVFLLLFLMVQVCYFFLIKCKNIIDQKGVGVQQYKERGQSPLTKSKARQACWTEGKGNKLPCTNRKQDELAE